jgi:hypothetical protein
LAKSLIAKSWETNPGAYRRATQRQAQKAATAPQKMILLSMIFSKESLLESKPVRESQKGNCSADSNISKI